jgi:ADP-ribose diphosphatase
LNTIKIIETKEIYSGRVSLRKDKFLMAGKTIEKEVIQHQDSVGVVPIIDKDTIILVTQYRHAAGKILLEIPAGKIEQDETAEQAAIREMAEEIGYSGKLEPLLKWYLAPGYSTEFMHIFTATNLKKIKRGVLDDDENIRVRKLKMTATVNKCLEGKIKDCKTIAAVLAYYNQQYGNSAL